MHVQRQFRGLPGGGIYTQPEAIVAIANTILKTGASGENLYGGIISRGHNLSNDAAGGDNGVGPGGLLNQPGDIRNTNPQIGPLADNGGPTKTMALLSNSPAIDAGNDANAPPVISVVICAMVRATSAPLNLAELFQRR